MLLLNKITIAIILSIFGLYGCVYDSVFPNLLLQDAVKYEDEHALQRVKDGEEVRHDHCTLVNIHQAERPGQAQQTEQRDGSDYPRSETHADTDTRAHTHTTHTHTHTHRERERHTHTHTQRERERERDTHTHTHTQRERERERERHTHTHTHTERERERHTHTHTQ